LLVVLGIAGLAVYRKQNKSSGGSDPMVGKKLLADFAFNDVSHILVREGTNELNLVKKDDRWGVQEREGYAANYSSISEFLIKLKDAKVVQSEQVGPSQLPKLWLSTSSPGTNVPVVVEFRDKAEKPIRTVLLGKKHTRKSKGPSPFGDMDDGGWPDGRYVMAAPDAKSVALISEPFSNIETKPEQWLNKDFFKVEKPRSIAVTFPEATNSWK